MDTISIDICVEITKYLDSFNDITSLKSTCKYTNGVVSFAEFWQKLFKMVHPGIYKGCEYDFKTLHKQYLYYINHESKGEKSLGLPKNVRLFVGATGDYDHAAEYIKFLLTEGLIEPKFHEYLCVAAIQIGDNTIFDVIFDENLDFAVLDHMVDEVTTEFYTSIESGNIKYIDNSLRMVICNDRFADIVEFRSVLDGLEEWEYETKWHPEMRNILKQYTEDYELKNYIDYLLLLNSMQMKVDDIVKELLDSVEYSEGMITSLLEDEDTFYADQLKVYAEKKGFVLENIDAELQHRASFIQHHFTDDIEDDVENDVEDE